MALLTVKVDNPKSFNVVMGQVPVDGTLNDIYEALTRTVPDAGFGLAYTPGTQQNAVTHTGTDDVLIQLARQNAGKIGANETFILFTDNSYAKVVMKALKDVDSIKEIYCATTRPVEVLMVEKAHSRNVMGLVGGYS